MLLPGGEGSTGRAGRSVAQNGSAGGRFQLVIMKYAWRKLRFLSLLCFEFAGDIQNIGR